MPWKRHLLRDAEIWAEVDATGQLIADSGGRVAVVYKRAADAKVYRASGRNLTPVAGREVDRCTVDEERVDESDRPRDVHLAQHAAVGLVGAVVVPAPVATRGDQTDGVIEQVAESA